MVSCPGALPFLRSNLTMLMSSFGSTSAVTLIESSGMNMYGLASTNGLISLRFVSWKLLHSIPKCLSTDSAKGSALSSLVLARFCSLVLV